MTLTEALEWTLGIIQADLEVIGEPTPGKQQNYDLNGVKMAHSTTFADSLAEARAALAASSNPREVKEIVALAAPSTGDEALTEALIEDADRDRALVAEWDATLPAIPDASEDICPTHGSAPPTGDEE